MEPEKMVCYNHPDRETLLRCNRCNRPMCNQCAVLTPTGYRCKECVRGQQKIFESARMVDYFVAGGIALVLGIVGSVVSSVMGFFTLFIAPITGMIIVEAVRWAVHRRRSKALTWTTVGAGVLGSLPFLLWGLLGGGILSILWQAAGVFLLASTIYYRMSGIQMRS